MNDFEETMAHTDADKAVESTIYEDDADKAAESAACEHASRTSHTYVMFSALFAPHVGGVEAYTAGLGRALVQQGHRVIVATSRLSKDDAEYEALPDGIEVYRLPCQSLLDGRLPISAPAYACARQLEIIAAAHPDRVVINTRFYGLSLVGAQFARKHNLPAIVIEHGSAHLSLGNPQADAVVERYEHAITTRMKSYGFPFFAVSEQARQWLSHFGIEGAGIVANALDAPAFEAAASARDFRAELGLTEDDVLAAVVGRLVPEKGIPAVLEAAQWLDAQSTTATPRIVFAVAGDGTLLERVKTAGRNVVALGRLNSSDVAALLRSSDVYLLPSRSEGFATTLLEAAAMHAYPLTTHVGGTDELGIGQDGGIILPDASAVSLVAALQVYCENQSLCKQQADDLHERVVQHNTWDASALQLDAAFEQCASETAGTAPASCAAASTASNVATAPNRPRQTILKCSKATRSSTSSIACFS